MWLLDKMRVGVNIQMTCSYMLIFYSLSHKSIIMDYNPQRCTNIKLTDFLCWMFLPQRVKILMFQLNVSFAVFSAANSAKQPELLQVVASVFSHLKQSERKKTKQEKKKEYAKQSEIISVKNWTSNRMDVLLMK